ncbi:transcriptional regulator [Streptosporangium sp. NPDC049046]|uniref:transcriptional regulator n=1 Tax=unclassified Streptosporangium TaxID=2632669 RepID=UPI00343F2521
MTRSESFATDTGLSVLHALRCSGASGLTRLAGTTGLGESDVESELIDLAVAGLVTYAGGDFGGWSLTDVGRAVNAERLNAELESAGARAAVQAAFDDFLVLNPELLELCTAWQIRSVDGVMAANDHRDASYDARVLARFVDFDRRAAVVGARLSAALPRFGRYRVRLTEALERAAAGELAYVADDFSSYHIVWAELHEDLHATLGIPRWV